MNRLTESHLNLKVLHTLICMNASHKPALEHAIYASAYRDRNNLLLNSLFTPEMRLCVRLPWAHAVI